MLDTVLADRAEKDSGERAVSLAADDEQVCRRDASKSTAAG